MPESSLLSILDFCREFNVSRSYAYRLLRGGLLKGVKIGRLTRIRRENAEKWMSKLEHYSARTAKREHIWHRQKHPRRPA